jgi:glycosyltransferase involved in cell wall biosynthesis
MKLWPENSALVLVGPARDSYKQSLHSLAVKVGVRHRVLFIGMVPLGDLDGLIAGADVAVALFPSDTSNLNFRYLAGASNKRFMYMSLAVAQVTNIGPGMSDIIERHKCGILANPNAPDEVGHAIRSLLENDPLREEMGRNGRRAHLSEFNYERQFTPVLDRILQWIR